MKNLLVLVVHLVSIISNLSFNEGLVASWLEIFGFLSLKIAHQLLNFWNTRRVTIFLVEPHFRKWFKLFMKVKQSSHVMRLAKAPINEIHLRWKVQFFGDETITWRLDWRVVCLRLSLHIKYVYIFGWIISHYHFYELGCFLEIAHVS